MNSSEFADECNFSNDIDIINESVETNGLWTFDMKM